MLKLNDVVMIKQNKYVLNNHVGYTGIITCIADGTNRVYLVTFEDNEKELYLADDLIDVSTYEHNEVD